MLTLELSSYVFEIPNDAYTTLSQIWLAAQHSVLQDDCLILEIYMKATVNINAPYFKLIIQGLLLRVKTITSYHETVNARIVWLLQLLWAARAKYDWPEKEGVILQIHKFLLHGCCTFFQYLPKLVTSESLDFQPRNAENDCYSTISRHGAIFVGLKPYCY